MRKIYLLSLLFILGLTAAQTEELEIQKHRTKEANSHAKMPAGNINPNTLNYDLRYQRLDLVIDPAINNIGGSVTSHFIPNQILNSIYFDFSHNVNVSAVQYHGTPLTFQQLPTKELKINFATAIPAGALDSLTVVYSGPPDPAYAGISNAAVNGSPAMASLSEPYAAQDWFPTKQSLNDKIEKFEFKINTPANYNVAANGVLMSETLLPNSRKLTYWRTMYPMTAYLAAFSIGNLTKLTDTIGNPPFPFINYLYPATVADNASMANINWTKSALTLFETYFGPYPFRNEKYGHMEYNFGGVCMEHQTMSSMSSWYKGVIAHELAHQWFGDKVTCGTWNDVWLNEGFATFGEHLVNEKLLLTPAQFQTYLEGQKNAVTDFPGGSTYVPDAQLGNVGRIFHGRLSYTKGGYIVRMMKWVLTDPVFYQAVQEYHSRPNLAYKYAVTSDLQASMLLSTGRDFTGFFNDWVYGEGYPTYDIKWNQLPNQNIAFKISQTQSHPSVSYFEMPVPLKVNGTGGQVAYFRPENTANGQIFVFPVTFPVASVEFNYERQILEKNSVVSQDSTMNTVEATTDNFAVYPIPASTEIYISGLKKSAKYEIFSSDGRLVESGKFLPANAIGIQKLIKGAYVLSIDGRNVKFVKK